MKIAAILSLSATADDSSVASAETSGTASELGLNARVDILGRSLLERVLAKLKGLGVFHHTIISQPDTEQFLRPSANATREANRLWEQAVAGYAHDGVDVLLLSRINTYDDIDYAEMLKFHLETGAPVTRAYASDGVLDLALVQVSQLRNVDGTYRTALNALPPRRNKFRYEGYVNRLASPQDFYTLIEDGLHGRCGLRPVGTETRAGVWQADDAELDNTAVIIGPTFIGEGSRVAPGCTIASGTSIERGCAIDCGTTVQESWVQQNTYVGVALDVRRSIVANDALFHLDRNVQVKIGEPELIGAAGKSAPFLATLGSLIWGERQAG